MSAAERRVDPWRFAGGFIQRALSAGIPDQPTHEPIPWTPLAKPLSESKVALLSKPAVAAPIVGATKLRHLEDAVAAVEIDLNEDEIAALEAPYRPHPVKGMAPPVSRSGAGR